MTNIRKILLTTDFSPTSFEAFEATKTVASKFDSEILLAHVDDDRYPAILVEYAAVRLEEIRQRQSEASAQQLSELAKERLGAFKTRTLMPQGVPHVEIVRLAEEQGVDLIVMATHGRGFLSHAIMGSTTERVLPRALPRTGGPDARGGLTGKLTRSPLVAEELQVGTGAGRSAPEDVEPSGPSSAPASAATRK